MRENFGIRPLGLGREVEAIKLEDMRRFTYLLGIVLLAAACREDEPVVQPTVTQLPTDNEGGQTPTPDSDPADSTATDSLPTTTYLGLYVLCEGNMGSNKATLDYLDLQSGQYMKNIFPSRNPQKVMELGDVGNDAQIYGSRLWLVVNCSNKVEVCDARTTRSIGQVDVPNCRYVCFDGGYAYVSSYVGPVPQYGGDNESRLGEVYKIDTLSLQVVDRCTVGYQPDELCVSGGKLYVANSGGYQPFLGHDYDYTVSQIDLATFREERKITVASNLFRIKADSRGQLWVSSRGVDDDDDPIPSRLYRLVPDARGQMQLEDSVDQVVTDFDIVGDTLYYCGAQAQGARMARYYGKVDVRTAQLLSTQLLVENGSWRIQTPYGIKVHPQTGDLYLMDATNYVSSGYLNCFDRQGRFKWSVATGDIPGHACWLTNQ